MVSFPGTVKLRKGSLTALARKVPRLNDQQWIMHRKKIGLSRKIKSPKQKTGESKSRKEDIVTFIRSNFKRKECVSYVHNPGGDTKDTYTKVHRHRPCHCGATAEEHRTVSEHRQGAASGPSQHPTILEEGEEGDTRHGIVINIEGPNDWKPNLAIRDFPTNAFGNIEFDGCLSLGSKFVRLAADTEMELVRRLYCAALYITVLHCTVLYCTIQVRRLVVDHWEMLSPRPRLAIGIIGGAQNFKLEGRKQQTFKVRKSRKRVIFLQSA